MISFYLSSLKVLSLNTVSYILRYWKLGLQHQFGRGGGTVWCIHNRLILFYSFMISFCIIYLSPVDVHVNSLLTFAPASKSAVNILCLPLCILG